MSKKYPWVKQLNKKDQATVKRWIFYANAGKFLEIIGYIMIACSISALIYYWE